MFKYTKFHIFLLVLEVLYFYSYEVDGNLQKDIAMQLRSPNSTSLSRTRRYLVFPQGSSFQLVFDLAYPTLDGIGLYVFGNTAAMAWELPSTPIFLDKKFKKKEEPEPEPPVTMLPHLEHPEEYDHHDWQPPLSWADAHQTDYETPSGWQKKAGLGPSYDVTYHSKFGNIDRSPVSSYSNPFASYGKKGFNLSPISNKHPVNYIRQNSPRGHSYRNNPSNFWTRRNFPIKRNQYQTRQTPLKLSGNRMDYYDRDLHHNIHRRTRRELYGKLEELLSALIKDGKSCILKTICQVNKTPKGKGTLFEELLKTIFKVKPEDFHEDEDHYDKAANQTHDCDAMYSECEGNVFNKVIKTALKK